MGTNKVVTVATKPQAKILAMDISKSDQIRRLAKAGTSRADISRLVGVRYQMVRNTLVRQEALETKRANQEAAQTVEVPTPKKVRTPKVVAEQVETTPEVAVEA